MHVERSFVIADLVGYTAAVDAHGDEVAVGLSQALERAVGRSLGPRDELVKSMGDAVLVASHAPADAVVFLRRLFDEFDDASGGLPMIRAAAHHGSAVVSGGDYFGSGVNVAARLAELSSGCQILGSTDIARAAKGLGIRVIDLGEFDLRNVSARVSVFEIDCGHDVRGHTVDPVCRMRVERSSASGTIRHDGREYVFCSLECIRRFGADPTRYADTDR